MKTDKTIDFTKIEWSKIGRKKAEFIYNEAIARLDSIHKNNDGITNKALGLLTISLPIMTALIGFFILQYGTLSAILVATSVCSAIFLFVILVVLLLILIPREVNSAQGEPLTYFTDDYYLQEMGNIYKGNIQALQNCINEDRAVLNYRGKLFMAAVLLFASFPVVTAIIAILTVIFWV